MYVSLCAYLCCFCSHTETHTYIHTCMHAYMHTCIHAYMHTCIHAYIHTYTHTHTYIHTCIHTYIDIHRYIHTYIHTYIHAHTYIHTYTNKNCRLNLCVCVCICIHVYIYIYILWTYTSTHSHSIKVHTRCFTSFLTSGCLSERSQAQNHSHMAPRAASYKIWHGSFARERLKSAGGACFPLQLCTGSFQQSRQAQRLVFYRWQTLNGP